MADWDRRFMDLAEHIGTKWSKDRSTALGCVIVGPDHEPRSFGYNGFPRGANDDIKARHERPLKYRWTEHAERTAVYNAARVGIPLKGCTAYVPWFPCTDCARAFIQSGIAIIVTYAPDFAHERWGEDWRVSVEMLDECGVVVKFITKNEE